MPQVSKNHYEFNNYLQIPRWTSYWHQIDEVLKIKPKNVLVIGDGDGVISAVLRNFLEYPSDEKIVFTFDFDKDLNPDFHGDVREIQQIMAGVRVDCILCCQVLEHIEYKHVNNVLEQFKQISNHVVISLPYSHKVLLRASLKLPKCKYRSFCLHIPTFYRKYSFNGEHYWELGTRQVSQKKIIKLLSDYFEIKKKYHVSENIYHVFFILETKGFKEGRNK